MVEAIERKMKGIILAGGSGSRLLPLTKITNKHLLPVYDKPMIYYPIRTLKKMGLIDILIVSGRHHAGHLLELLGRGEEMGVRFSYTLQEKAGGIAEALSLAEDYSEGDNVAVILGDNIFEDSFSKSVKDFNYGAEIFLKEVPNAQRFGVAELRGSQVIGIEEKPEIPKTNYAVTGLYLYDSKVFGIIKTLKPSRRNELEITGVNNAYIKDSKVTARFVRGFWSDAGTFESLNNSAEFVQKNQDKFKF